MRNLHLILLQEYGREARCLFREWERLRLRQIDYQNHRIFTLRCLHKELVPVSLKLKSTVNTTKARKIINKAEKELTQARIKSINNTLTNVSTQLQQCRSQLAAIISTERLRECQDFVDKVGKIRFIKVKDRQIKKFQNLVNKKQGNITWSSNSNNNSNPFPTASNTNRQAGTPPLPSGEAPNTPPARPLPPSQEGESLTPPPHFLIHHPRLNFLLRKLTITRQLLTFSLKKVAIYRSLAAPPTAWPGEGSHPPAALPPARDGGSPPPNRAI